jgi:WD40 repeat protein
MSEVRWAGPPTYGWIAAVHASEHDRRPLGAAIVIDARRLLTCTHILVDHTGEVRDQLWVSFPAPAELGRRLVASVYQPTDLPHNDVAVLTISDDVPVGVSPATLRCPEALHMIGRRWWALGFPEQDLGGDTADGQVDAALALGLVRLETTSRHRLQEGFSGTGLWSPDYQAIVGIVVHASGSGDGRAITLLEAARCLPNQNLALLMNASAEDFGEEAMAAWGWSLTKDPEGTRHWRPRARGVSVDSERGYRFRGRSRALTEIKSWLDRAEPDRRVLVITGSPGVGKSAVLGRVVTTSDPTLRAELPSDDDAIRATVGSVACAVHAKGKTALDVATEVARAASARLPGQPADLAPAVREALEDRAQGKFNVIIDALDECATTAEARTVITKIVLPLAETCSDLGTQVIVGTRRNDDEGSLLDSFGRAAYQIDLDTTDYFTLNDLAAYALACLQLVGDERPGNPYHDQVAAESLARRIAELADRNFLIAGLIARGRGMHDTEAVDAAQVSFDATVDAALREYLDRAASSGGLAAREILTALAFAEAPGLSFELWTIAVESLYGHRLRMSDLISFGRSSTANFLVESSTSGATEPVFRLFHQALSDALLRARSQIAQRCDDEAALVQAFTDSGRSEGWAHAPQYLLRSLPRHAAAAGMIDDLLADDVYLLYADLTRLMLRSTEATSAVAKRTTRLIGLTPGAAKASGGERAAQFSVTQALEGMPISFTDTRVYAARWASTQHRAEVMVLEGHTGWVRAVCPITIHGRAHLASGGNDGTVRIWNLATGERTTLLEGHTDWVSAVCPVTIHGRAHLATASSDGTVRIWDTATSQQIAIFKDHRSPVRTVCPITIHGQPLLATAGNDGSVPIWDLATGQMTSLLEGQADRVNAVCPVTIHGRAHLATASSDGTVWIWNLATSQQSAILKGHRGRVYAVCPVTIHDRPHLATAGFDSTVRIWDLATGQQTATLRGHVNAVFAVCSVTIHDRPHLATAGNDGTIRMWNLATSHQTVALEGHANAVNGICPVNVHDRPHLATAGSDGTVRIWDPAAGQQTTTPKGHAGPVRAVCPVTINGHARLATAGSDGTVRIWDGAAGQLSAVLKDHVSTVFAICSVTVDDRPHLAAAGSDGTVRIWDPVAGRLTASLKGHNGPVFAVCSIIIRDRPHIAAGSYDGAVVIWDPAACLQTATLKGRASTVYAVCPVTINGRPHLAAAGYEGTVRIWDLATGHQTATLEGHPNTVNAICPVTIQGHPHLATAGNDGTVRIWDLRTHTGVLSVPVHHWALAVAWLGDSLAVGLSAGVLVFELLDDLLRH